MSIPGVNTSGYGGDADVWSGAVACAGTGYCAVLGTYNRQVPGGQVSYVFVWSKTNGVWQPAAAPLPGFAGTPANALALTCVSAGNCTGGGTYARPGDNEPFVIDESRGVWGKAQPLRGIAPLNTAHYAVVTQVSCGAPGYCTAAGSYQALIPYENGVSQQVAFMASEVKGRWGAGHPVSGLAALRGVGVVTAVSCSSAANCAIVGTAGSKAFVLSERSGVWGKATQVAGTTAGPAALEALSCDKAGDCTAAGTYTPKAHATGQAFVVTEKGSRWGTAHALAGYGAKGGQVFSISCPAAGYCTAVGGSFYANGARNVAASFTVDEVRGLWRQAAREPAPYSLFSVSCSAPGTCAAAGQYTAYSDTVGGTAAVAAETGGTWGGYQQLPGEPVQSNIYWSPTLSPLSCGTTTANCAIWGYWEAQYGPFNQWVSTTAAAS
jgi:hypothetical protein